MKWKVYGRVVATTWVGEYEAETENEAHDLAMADASSVGLCHQCAKKVGDNSLELDGLIVEPAEKRAMAPDRPDGFYWLGDSAGWTVGRKNDQCSPGWLYRGAWHTPGYLARWKVTIGPRIEEPAYPPTGRAEPRQGHSTASAS